MSLGTAADWHRAASELEKQTPQLGHIKETWNSWAGDWRSCKLLNLPKCWKMSTHVEPWRLYMPRLLNIISARLETYGKSCKLKWRARTARQRPRRVATFSASATLGGYFPNIKWCSTPANVSPYLLENKEAINGWKNWRQKKRERRAFVIMPRDPGYAWR